MSSTQLIVLASPVFFALMALEWWRGRRRGRPAYRLADAIASLQLGLLSQTSAAFTALLRVGLYTLAWQQWALWRNDAFWHAWYGWALALLLYDLCYYWLHRMGHEVAVLWAAHAVHHQSQDYNLSTALRQTSSGALLGWLFYLPLALAGVPPLVFVVVGLVDLLYQFWVHTEQVGRLGWFDRWFCSPSNHRVHHAVNDRYLDKNYGGILIVWDRLFGTFEDEDARAPCVYGTRSPLNSWDPLWANAQVYADLARASCQTPRWRDKLRLWWMPPGWQPPGSPPKPAFELAAVRRFDPPMAPLLRGFAALQFALLLAGSAAFLWRADSAPLAENALWFAALLACQWALAAATQARLSMGEALMLQAGALASATGALGLVEWHLLCKPAAMIFALITVASHARQSDATGVFRLKSQGWLLAALAGSLAGDVALMLPGLFLPGLGSFLLAHLAYIALFHRGGVRWLASRRALALALLAGAAMYAFLWTGGLPAPLRAPVAAYVLVIALMAAQAWARYRALGDAAARRVALGACFFLLSDALLATNQFVTPLPWAPLWVLATYYAAQALIVHGMLRAAPARRQSQTRSQSSPPPPCGAATPRWR